MPFQQPQQQVPFPVAHHGGLEQWFGNNIYHSGLPQIPTNAKIMSLEEIEKAKAQAK
jgi:hypothetical protein